MKSMLLAAGMTVGASCLGQTIELPDIHAGDTWKYRNTTEKGQNSWIQTDEEVTVSRVTASSIYYSVHKSGSTQPAVELIAGRDWSRIRDVNGKETLVNQPLAFPLAPGKHWDVDYTEQKPNKAHRSENWHSAFTVVGYETVEVPAGRFNALKVESEGRWTAEVEPSQSVVQGAQTGASGTTMVTQLAKTDATSASGRTYKAFWYAPEARRWVKSVEEYYTSAGVRNERYTGELTAFSAMK
jgi:hypothetical protein